MVQPDPRARQDFVRTIAEQWESVRLEIEFCERSVTGAREFARTWRDGKPFLDFGWLQLQFVEFLSVLLIGIGGYGALEVLEGDFSAEIKASVITLVLIGGFTQVLVFWLGSSRDSQRKTEMLGR